jgi:hypothetical protein
MATITARPYPPVAPPEQTVAPAPRDDQAAILYSSIVFLCVVAIFWSLPVSFVWSRASRSAKNTWRLQIIRVIINPLKVLQFPVLFHCFLIYA